MNPRLQPRVNKNDWGILEAPEPGAWTPRLSVSVIIPAYAAEGTLPYTLAALAAQTYPSELLEVVVVDDGSNPELELPRLCPANTRLIRAKRSWGQANAIAEGVEIAEGDVVHRLDSDMVPRRDHVERQLRWHHVIDHAVVLGHKLFTDREGLPPVARVAEAVEADTLERLFGERWTGEHDWVEKIWRRTNDLRTAGFRAFHVSVGGTGSVSRDLYMEAGGMDPSLKLSEDIELGYRLEARGGVFIADRTASGWHLGRSMLMRQQLEVQRHNAPFIAERIPDLRKFRQVRGRMYRVPGVEVVVDTTGHAFEEVKYTVDGVLQSAPGDVRCLLVGGWADLRDDRRSVLADPLLDLRLLREEYASEARVAFVDHVPVSAFPALFRLHLPAGWRPAETTLEALTRDMQNRAMGLRSSVLPDGRVARLELTAAFERARRVMEEGEDIDDVVDQVSGTWWSEGLEDGFLHQELAPGTGERQERGTGLKRAAQPAMTPPVEPREAADDDQSSTAGKTGVARLKAALRPRTSR